MEPLLASPMTDGVSRSTGESARQHAGMPKKKRGGARKGDSGDAIAPESPHAAPIVPFGEQPGGLGSGLEDPLNDDEESWRLLDIYEEARGRRITAGVSQPGHGAASLNVQTPCVCEVLRSLAALSPPLQARAQRTKLWKDICELSLQRDRWLAEVGERAVEASDGSSKPCVHCRGELRTNASPRVGWRKPRDRATRDSSGGFGFGPNRSPAQQPSARGVSFDGRARTARIGRNQRGRLNRANGFAARASFSIARATRGGAARRHARSPRSDGPPPGRAACCCAVQRGLAQVDRVDRRGPRVQRRRAPPERAARAHVRGAQEAAPQGPCVRASSAALGHGGGEERGTDSRREGGPCVQHRRQRARARRRARA